MSLPAVGAEANYRWERAHTHMHTGGGGGGSKMIMHGRRNEYINTFAWKRN